MTDGPGELSARRQELAVQELRWPDPEAVRLVAAWQSVIDGFNRAQRRVMTPIEAAGMPEAHFAALMLLAGAEDRRLPMSKLAQELGMTSGGFTKLADRLAREGLIDRRNSSGDRRVVYATLTDAGERTVADARDLYVRSVRTEVLDVLGADDLERGAALFRRLRDAMTAPLPEGADEPPFVPRPRDPDLPDRRRSER